MPHPSLFPHLHTSSISRLVFVLFTWKATGLRNVKICIISIHLRTGCFRKKITAVSLQLIYSLYFNVGDINTLQAHRSQTVLQVLINSIHWKFKSTIFFPGHKKALESLPHWGVVSVVAQVYPYHSVTRCPTAILFVTLIDKHKTG